MDFFEKKCHHTLSPLSQRLLFFAGLISFPVEFFMFRFSFEGLLKKAVDSGMIVVLHKEGGFPARSIGDGAIREFLDALPPDAPGGGLVRSEEGWGEAVSAWRS